MIPPRRIVPVAVRAPLPVGPVSRPAVPPPVAVVRGPSVGEALARVAPPVAPRAVVVVPRVPRMRR
jgi:hypothetical protein